MKQILSAIVVLIGSLVTARAVAVPATRPAAVRYDAVASYVDEQTYCILGMDVKGVDPGALISWIDKAAATDSHHEESDQSKPRALQQLLQQFSDAGGRDVYVVASFSDPLGTQPAVIAPLDPGTDPAPMIRFLTPPPSHSYGFGGFGDSIRVEQIGSAVVSAPDETLRRLRETRPANRPDLKAAFDGSRDATLIVAAALPPEGRKVIEQLMPMLPKGWDDASTRQLTQGLTWVRLTAQFPPDPSAELTMDVTDRRGAEAVAAVIRSAAEHAGGKQPFVRKVLAKLMPEPEAEHPQDVVVRFDSAALTDLLSTAMHEAGEGRAMAERVKSASNIRTLILGCIMYADGHKGTWPPDLSTAIKVVGGSDELLINPSRRQVKSGYTYLNPGTTADNRDASNSVVIYETDSGIEGRNVGFADGHVAFLTEKELRHRLESQRSDRSRE